MIGRNKYRNKDRDSKEERERERERKRERETHSNLRWHDTQPTTSQLNCDDASGETTAATEGDATALSSATSVALHRSG